MMTQMAIIPQRERPDVLALIAGAGNLAESTKAQYTRAVERYQDAGGDLFDPEQLAGYARDLPASGRSFLKAAVKLVTDRLAVQVKGAATPENVAAVQATLYRAEALQDAIQVSAPRGTKAHLWLSRPEVIALLDTCGDDLKGQRDRLALGLLVAAGLRCSEAVGLGFDAVKLQPVAGKMRTVLEVVGKGSKRRVVPISDRLANAIDAWAGVVGGDGRILRSITKGGELGESLSTVGLFDLVRAAGAAIGKPGFGPHDLRRTYAQLGYEAGVPVTQISRLLGHSSISTTQRYLNLDLDLDTTISDFVPF
jgi:integrase